MDKRLSQEQQLWLEACIKDINNGDNLFRLFESLKPIMTNRMRKYLRDIPYYDEEDYFQTGLIVLWDNIERIRNNPEIQEKSVSQKETHCNSFNINTEIGECRSSWN